MHLNHNITVNLDFLFAYFVSMYGNFVDVV